MPPPTSQTLRRPHPWRAAAAACGLAAGAAAASGLTGCAAARSARDAVARPVAAVGRPVAGAMRQVPGVRRLVPVPRPAPVEYSRQAPVRTARPAPAPIRTAPPAPAGPTRGGWNPGPAAPVPPRAVPADPFAEPGARFAPAAPPPAPVPPERSVVPRPVGPIDDPSLIGPMTEDLPAETPAEERWEEDRPEEQRWEPAADPDPAEAVEPPPAPAAPVEVDANAVEEVPELPADPDDDLEAYYPVGRNPLAALLRSFRGDRSADRGPAAVPPARTSPTARAAATPTVLVSHQVPAAAPAPRRPAVRLGTPVFDADPADAALWTPADPAAPEDPFGPIPAPFPGR